MKIKEVAKAAITFWKNDFKDTAINKLADIDEKLQRVVVRGEALRGLAHELDKKEKQLKESEERYRRLAEVTLDAFFFHDYKKIVDINPAFTRLTGYTVEEVNSVPLFEAFKKFVLPEFWPRIQDSWDNKLKEPYRVEARNKDGNIIFLEIQCGDVNYCGKPYRVCMLRDLTGTVVNKERFSRVHNELYELFQKNPSEFDKRFKAHIDYISEKGTE